MKRIGNLFEKICSIENLKLADEKARKGKSKQYGIKLHDKNRENNILLLHESLKNKTYKTSEYNVFEIHEPKIRKIYSLPYYPDRIVHHGIMNILESIFLSVFTTDSYSCIKGKGIHGALLNLNEDLKDRNDTEYCLKLDIKKFYPSINNTILKSLLRKKFKDKDLLWLLDEIIDSAEGCPIGNYLSQTFANFYLAYFDHWLKENKKIKYYFRYCDDMVILSDNKKELHELLLEINNYLNVNLKLELKSNYQIFSVEARGIDFVGYKSFHDFILLRKSIKNKFIKMLRFNKNNKSISSYYGWFKYCDSYKLMNKYIPNYPSESL